MFYVKKTLFLHNLTQNNASWNALYVERGLQLLDINCLQQCFTSTFDNFDKPMWHVKASNYNLEQIFCLEISGPKVVLLPKFSLYRAVSLSSLMDDPALSGTIRRCVTVRDM